MPTNGALRMVGEEAPKPPPGVAVWTAADVQRFFNLPSEDMARRRIAKLEKGGTSLRVPEIIAGRKCLVYAARLLQAAQLSEAEIQAVLSTRP